MPIGVGLTENGETRAATRGTLRSAVWATCLGIRDRHVHQSMLPPLADVTLTVEQVAESDHCAVVQSRVTAVRAHESLGFRISRHCLSWDNFAIIQTPRGGVTGERGRNSSYWIFRQVRN